MIEVNNIDEDWQVGTTNTDKEWSFRDLSGDKLGVRIENCLPAKPLVNIIITLPKKSTF